MEQFKNTDLENTNIAEHRQCGNCKREYHFYDIKKNYPEFFHNELKKIWQNPEIEFFCSYCYLIKIIGFLKKD